jgi:impB/mucB/samB family C-terminal domain
VAEADPVRPPSGCCGEPLVSGERKVAGSVLALSDCDNLVDGDVPLCESERTDCESRHVRARDWGRIAAPPAMWRVAEDVPDGQRRAVRVIMKVRYAPFTTCTPGRVLTAPSSDVETLDQAALAALDASLRRPVRLLGVRAELEV